MKLRQTTATSARSTYHVPRERAALDSIALRKHDIVIISGCVKKITVKFRKEAPGLIIFQRPFFGGAYLRTDICVTKYRFEGLIFGGAYTWWVLFSEFYGSTLVLTVRRYLQRANMDN